MGGSNDATNLVRLTGREHFVCHLLLTKMVNDPLRHKALKAARMMATTSGPGQHRYKVTSRIYESLMKESLAVSNETRIKMGASQKLRFEKSPGTFKNKKLSEKTKKLLSIAFLVIINQSNLFAQSISAENIEYETLIVPVFATEEGQRTDND
jgi:hypothetical protein